MKAIVYEKYGGPEELQLKDIPKPVPTDDQVLIKIHAVSINGSDKENLVGSPFYIRFGGLFKPRDQILGSDIAGVVEAVGKNHTEFKVGDAVFGEIPNYHYGFAEYVCTNGKTLTLKPPHLTFAEASIIPQAGSITWQGIHEKGAVLPGQHVLINGAGGSTGSFAIQLAKHLGAEVTGVDNGHKLQFMRSVGADHTIDYTKQDFTKTGIQYDLILDLVAHRSPFAYRRALKPNGKYFLVGGQLGSFIQVLLFGPIISKRANKHLRLLAVPQNRQDILAITQHFTDGTITPYIDKTYPLEQTADAFRYMLSGQFQGKIVIEVIPQN